MFFDTWSEEALNGILKTQRAVVEHQKKEKASKRSYGIAIIVHDFAESPAVMASRAGGKALNTLLVRGMHMMISSFILTQKLRIAGSILRVNAQALIVFRLRNRLELDAIIEALSAMYPNKIRMEMYQLAAAEPYSFMYINLAASRVEDMMWLRFESRMLPTDAASPNVLQEQSDAECTLRRQPHTVGGYAQFVLNRTPGISPSRRAWYARGQASFDEFIFHDRHWLQSIF